jgi:hypothetical protein
MAWIAPYCDPPKQPNSTWHACPGRALNRDCDAAR